MADTLIRFSALVTETSNSRDLAVGSGIRELEHQLTRVHYTAYVLALAVSISTWLVAIRAPLWVDETISLFLIRDGFSGIARQMWPDSQAYSYLLLLWTKVNARRRSCCASPPSLLCWARCFPANGLRYGTQTSLISCPTKDRSFHTTPGSPTLWTGGGPRSADTVRGAEVCAEAAILY
jgi:hypothetical protein